MNDLTKNVRTKDERDVVIYISDDGSEIRVKTLDAKEIGGAHLSLVEHDDGEYYRLTWMYLDKLGGSYRQQGLGRAALLFHKESFDVPIEVAEDDGHTRSDGGHLTGDAPGFVEKMVREGILSRNSENDTSPNHDGEEE